MRKYNYILILIYTLFQSTGISQEFGRGLLLDESLFENVPIAAPLMRGDFINLPPNFSLKDYAPTPGNQGIYATCAGWSAGYSARTILYSIKSRIVGPLINQNTFSPSFVYNKIRVDSTCTKGVSLVDALELLKEHGILKLSEFEYECNRTVEFEDIVKAGTYKILEYRQIFSNKTKDKVLLTKKSISEYKPILIAMDCPDSFMKCQGLWEPEPDDYKLWSKGHGIVVIGYDDNKHGGAFEVINSWGTNWGQEGFGWIKYSDFSYFCLFGFELIDNIFMQDTDHDLSGSLIMKLESGNQIETIFNGDYFETKESLSAGTKFELRISNNQPAYVYCISSDLYGRVSKLFPYTEKTSPLLPYKSNNIAIPDENSLMMLDNISGKTYLAIIYSKKPISINDVIVKAEKLYEKFPSKIKKILFQDMVEQNGIQFSVREGIVFKATSLTKSLVLIIVEFDHL